MMQGKEFRFIRENFGFPRVRVAKFFAKNEIYPIGTSDAIIFLERQNQVPAERELMFRKFIENVCGVLGLERYELLRKQFAERNPDRKKQAQEEKEAKKEVRTDFKESKIFLETKPTEAKNVNIRHRTKPKQTAGTTTGTIQSGSRPNQSRSNSKFLDESGVNDRTESVDTTGVEPMF